MEKNRAKSRKDSGQRDRERRAESAPTSPPLSPCIFASIFSSPTSTTGILSGSSFIMSVSGRALITRSLRVLPSTLPRVSTALPLARPTALYLQPITHPYSLSRTFTSTTHLAKDTSWQSKGPLKYTELKPETSSPSGQITIIDVREPNEVAQGIIPSAVNVPLSQFQKAFSGSGGDFQKEYAFQRPAYDDKVVFYCRSGKRSQQALEFAQKNGWWNVRNYEGSWLDWVQQEKARGQTSKKLEDDD